MNPLMIFLVIVVAILAFFLIKYAMSDTSSIIDALKNGKDETIVKADTLSGGDSSNFAYSSWFYVNDLNYRYDQSKILYMRASTDANGFCPKVSLDQMSNNLTIIVDGKMDTDATTLENKACKVPNIPIQKWVHLVVSVYGRTLDVYIDGKLVKTCLLEKVAAPTASADLRVTPEGGFDGWTSKMSYYSSALNPQQVWNLYTKAPVGWMSNLPSYQVQLSLMENGTTQTSVTI